jgi:hypothetical protein
MHDLHQAHGETVIWVCPHINDPKCISINFDIEDLR